MRHGGLQDWYQLVLIAREASSEKRGAEGEAQHDRVDGREQVGLALLRSREPMSAEAESWPLVRP